MFQFFKGRAELPDEKWVAQVQRSENPDAGCHLSRQKPDLEVSIGSGSFNVICITGGGFTLLGQFLRAI